MPNDHDRLKQIWGRIEDEDGGSDGIIYGRDYDIQEWRHRKEQERFERLCRRLQLRRWRKLRREKDPEKARGRWRRWASRSPEKIRSRNSDQYEKRKARLCHNGLCARCRARWSGRRPRIYCSTQCQIKAKRQRKTVLIKEQMVKYLFAHPGVTLRWLCKEAGLNITSVREVATLLVKGKVLRRERYCYSLTARAKHRFRPANPCLDIGEMSEKQLLSKIEELYNEHLSIRKIADRFQVSYGFVSARLEKAGVERRARGSSAIKQYPADLVGQVDRLYGTGLSMRGVASRLGITDKVVWRLMKRHGIKARKAGAQ